ncbi:hypothetical protein C4J81_15525 [Deltaproteobacteria bacterium Smac51]|nr:hypothetical protein C4J81_15525 [Deltaproteobacteria bacterium Smac51]
MDIGERIKQVRGKDSRREMAEKLNVDQSTIVNYENNRRLPNSDFLANLCKSYNISADWLILGKEKEVMQELTTTPATVQAPTSQIKQPEPPKQIYDNEHEVFDIPRQAVDKWAMEISPTAFNKLWDEFRSSTRSKQGWTQIELVERFPEFVRWLEQKFGLDEDDEDYEPKPVRGIKAKRQDENDDLDLRFDHDFNTLHPKR